MSKFVKYILYILLVISAIFIVAFFINQDAVLDSFLYYTYTLIGIALLAVVVLPLINLFNNPKNLKKILTGVVAVVVLVGVSFLLSSGDPISSKPNMQASENVLRMTDTGLILTYILATLAFLSIVVGGVVNMFRNK
ncbi:MAG: hypothetical protein ABFC28_06110 [Rikenellaceae bacterium]